MLILKQFKNQGKLWKMLAEEKMATNLIENGIFRPKNLRDDEKLWN